MSAARKTFGATATRARLPLSFSRIEDLSCPYRFKAKHIDKFKEPQTAPLVIGGAVHDFCEQYQKRLAAAGAETDLTTAAALASTISGAIPVQFADAADEAERLMLGWAQDHLARLDTFQEAELQMAFREDWSSCGWFAADVFYRAMVDRIDAALDEDGSGAIEITDYSTSWKIGDQKKFQLECYCMAIALRLQGSPAGFEPSEFRVFTEFIRHAYRRGPEVYGPGVVELTKKRILQVSDQVEAMRERGVWPAQPGGPCAWCRVPNCPALTDEARDPVAIAGRLLLLSREQTELEERLKTHAATQGPVTVGDGAFGYWPTETKKIDREAWLAAGGAPEAQNITVTAARKYMKGRPDLQALVEVKKSSKWGFKKEGAVNED